MSERLNIYKLTDIFLIWACAAVLILRLVLPALLQANQEYVYSEFAQTLISGLMLLLALLYLVRKYLLQETLCVSGFEFPLTLLACGALLSLTRSVYPEGSVLYIINTAAQVMYFYMLIDMLRNPLAQRVFLMAAVVVLGLVGFFAIFEYFLPSSSFLHGTDKFVATKLSYRRVGSLFGAPNVLAGFYIIILPVLGAWCFLARERLQKIIAVLLLVVSLIAFSMTLSFLCTVNLLVVTAVLSPWLYKEWTGCRPGKLFWILLVTIALVALAGILFSRGDLSVSSRWGYLNAAWELIKNHGLWGSGLDSFRYLSPQFTQELTYSGYVHNSYLQLWLEAGVSGLIGIVFFLIFFIRQAFKFVVVQGKNNLRFIKVALMWGLLVLFVDNLTNFTLIDNLVSVYAWSMLAWWVSLQAPVNTAKQAPALLLVLIFIVAGLLWKNSQHMSFLKAYQQGMQSLESKEYVAGFQQLQKAQEISPANQHVYAGKGFFYLQIYRLAFDRRFLDKAYENYLEAARLSPYYYLNYVMLSKIANEQGDQLKLQQHVATLKELCPSRHPFLERELEWARYNKQLTKRP